VGQRCRVVRADWSHDGGKEALAEAKEDRTSD